MDGREDGRPFDAHPFGTIGAMTPVARRPGRSSNTVGASGRPPKLLCCICRRKPAEALGRCATCRRYRWLHGYDRPLELVEKEIEPEARKVARLLDGR